VLGGYESGKVAGILRKVTRFRGIGVVPNGWSGALLAVGIWLVSQLSGCASSSTEGTSCGSKCSDLCTALQACDAEVPSNCVSQCARGVEDANCVDFRPLNQLTCAELKAAYACADYCATLCERAPECGSFDSKLCAQGCAIQSPSICNAASVAARTCEQLKPELRDDEDVARAEQTGSHVDIDFTGTNPYGLCTTIDDCEQPLGCARETNTCSPCASNDDCKGRFQKKLCSPEHECVEVGCVDDKDCGGVCDAEQHVCVGCREDADCTGSVFKRCDTETATCRACLSDDDCSGKTSRCDLSEFWCRECLSNDDCPKKQSLPRCDLALHICSLCQGDSQCPSGMFCTSSGACAPK
jgi:hypothetical protein